MIKRGYVSVFQILILIVSIFAVSYLIGNEFQIVSSVDSIDWMNIPSGAQIDDGSQKTNYDLWIYNGNVWIPSKYDLTTKSYTSVKNVKTLSNAEMRRVYEEGFSFTTPTTAEAPATAQTRTTTPTTSSVTLPAQEVISF